MLIDFRERGERGRKTMDVGEKHQSVASHRHPNQAQTQKLGVCPDLEPNPPPFGV